MYCRRDRFAPEADAVIGFCPDGTTIAASTVTHHGARNLDNVVYPAVV